MVEDWLIHWNDKVDQVAVDCNSECSDIFWEIRAAYESSLNWWSQRIRQIRSLHFRIADDEEGLRCPGPDILVVSSDEEIDLCDSFSDLLPLNWEHQCHEGSGFVLLRVRGVISVC